MFPSFNARAAGLSLGAGTTIDLAAAAGFVGVDLLVRDLVDDGEDPALLRRRMDDLGLIGGAFPLPMDWRGDEATFRRDLDALPRLADVAAGLGLLRTATWVMPELPEGLDRPATVALHVDRLGAIAAILRARSIRIGLEAIGVERFRSGERPAFLTRLSDLGPVMDPLAEALPNVGLLLDAFHLHASGESLDRALDRGVGAVVGVHVADLPAGPAIPRDRIEDHDRGLPGETGTVDVPGILRTLAEHGYAGPVIAEPIGRCRNLAGLDSTAVGAALAASLRGAWPAEGRSWSCRGQPA